MYMCSFYKDIPIYRLEQTILYQDIVRLTVHKDTFIRYNEGIRFKIIGGNHMNLALLIGVMVVFFTSFFTSGYEAKAGIPRKQ